MNCGFVHGCFAAKRVEFAALLFKKHFKSTSGRCFWKGWRRRARSL